MAKIHVVYDNDGKIIAASESKNLARPGHMHGVTQGEFDVPAKFGGKKLHEYLPFLLVDVAARHLKERGEEQKGKR